MRIGFVTVFAKEDHRGSCHAERMRVLILTSQMHEGAAELLGVDLAVNLNRCGVQAMVACMYSEATPGTAAAKAEILGRGVPSVLVRTIWQTLIALQGV